MAFTSIEISLPEPLKEYVESRVEHGEFGTPSEFLGSLIRQDKERRMQALEDDLIEALDSGEVEITRAELLGGDLIACLEAKLAQRTR